MIRSWSMPAAERIFPSFPVLDAGTGGSRGGSGGGGGGSCFVSALGGSVAMMSTMLIIRHKTKHHKFMYGIPVIIIIQLSLIAVLSEYI